MDKKSVHFQELSDLGLLIRTEHGANQTYDFQGDCLEIDVTNPAAQEYLWKVCKENYADLGIDMFWLDNAEPDYTVYDFDNYRYHIGTALETTNIYPQLHAKAFWDGQKTQWLPPFRAAMMRFRICRQMERWRALGIRRLRMRPDGCWARKSAAGARM